MHEDDTYNMLEGKIKILQWFKDYHRAKAFFIANSKDPMPFIVSVLIHARQFGKMILRKCYHLNIKYF